MPEVVSHSFVYTSADPFSREYPTPRVLNHLVGYERPLFRAEESKVFI